jgi:hypothetical protein
MFSASAYVMRISLFSSINDFTWSKERERKRERERERERERKRERETET